MVTVTAGLVETQLIVGGEWRPALAGGRYELFNPAHPREQVGTAAAGTAADVGLAVAAAHRAFPAWAGLSYAERAARLVAVAEDLGTDSPERGERVRLLTREHGKVLRESQMELSRLGDRFGYCASLAGRLAEEERLSGPPFDTLIARRPRGVAALITPWNWPLSILGAKLPQALIAGNTVVVKLSERATLAAALTVRRIAEALPPGVVNLVTGSGPEVGEALLSHPLVAQVNFTGSIATGRHVMRTAAATLKHVTLELGGNDPALILDDADLDETALRRLAGAVFMTAGQVCMAVKRIYVHASRYRELLEGLSGVVAESVVGDGLDPRVTMGPLNNRPQLEFVRGLVAEARERGATVRELGRIADAATFREGYFHRPTLVTDVDPSLQVVRCEQFGPVVPILPFEGDDQAVAWANDTEYGLCSSVWTESPERALAVARRLQAGYTYLNAHGPAAQDGRAPFGGVKQSGIGRNLGYQGVLEFMDWHSISGPPGGLP